MSEEAEKYLKENTEYNFEHDEVDLFHLRTIAHLMQSFSDQQNKELKEFLSEFVEAWELGMGGNLNLYQMAKEINESLNK